MRSILLGGLIAPLAAPVIFFLGTSLISVFRDGPVVGLHDWQAGLLLVMVFVLPVSYLATWVLGVPYIFWLRSRSRLTATHVCAGAVVFGVISAWVYQCIGKVGPLQMEHLAWGALFGAGLALCVAMAFCLVTGISSESTA